jgi:tRNA-Thr(GGU) m(6)t(6)A37 methyltransferase TsaA
MVEVVTEIVLSPVGVVRSPIENPVDDVWGGVMAVIELDAGAVGPQASKGLEEFSHIEVLFHMHRVSPDRIETNARHPRGRLEWPAVGIFAQRGRVRPNRVGASICRLVKVEGLRLTVLDLDAIDGTPVIDVKPYMTEFGPKGDVRQPAWSRELMADYFTDRGTKIDI